MADKKISALTGASTPLAGTEVLPIVQGGATVKVAVSNLTAGRQVGMSSYNIGITAFTPTAAGTISDGTDNTAAEKITELLVVSDDNSWKTSGASFAAYRTYLSVSGATIYVSNGAARYRSVNFTPEGNIALATANKGIDFSANANAPGMTSELLKWYEEGTWTPNQGAGLTVVGAFSSSGSYTRIGRQVTIFGKVAGATSVACSTFGVICTNLPFNPAAFNGFLVGGSPTAIQPTVCSAGILYSINAVSAGSEINFVHTYFV